ncbi:hypothetical protein [Methylobacterium sp. CCH7-A2]|uniref:hypothetical protein n=1 Tax=Methylobacterium sp. CCH7-A2 TaxID=1768789 RepID=UPI0012E3337B|nr:hypothetical protein [Methylobacterium sp. CCH7-A2]
MNGAKNYGSWCEGKSVTRIFAPRNWLLRRDWTKTRRGGETASDRSADVVVEPQHVAAYRALGDIDALMREPLAADRSAAEEQLRRWPDGRKIEAARDAIEAVRRASDAEPAELARIINAALDLMPSSARRAAMVKHVAGAERLPAALALQAMRRLVRTQRTAPTIADIVGALDWSWSALDALEGRILTVENYIGAAIERFDDPDWHRLLIELGFIDASAFAKEAA